MKEPFLEKLKSLRAPAVNFLKILLIFFIISSAYKISELNLDFQNLVKSNNEKIADLENQISILNEKLTITSGENEKIASSIKEISNKQSLQQKSQEELITGAVAKVAPAVVSIVALKDVPKVEVVYQNPFGDNPFFKDFNIQVPVIVQKGTEKSRVSAGTGFVITKDGFVITNKHVVNDTEASYTAFLPDGKNKDAYVIYRDPINDVAILKIVGDQYKAVELGNSATLKVGQTVIAIGNALGEYDNSVSTGIISGLNRTIEASGGGITEKLSGIIQTDAAINIGNSGGPLVDINGNVIGINVATAVGGNNIGFSIPINTIKDALRKVIGRVF